MLNEKINVLCDNNELKIGMILTYGNAKNVGPLHALNA